jgi:hypothetical protein
MFISRRINQVSSPVGAECHGCEIFRTYGAWISLRLVSYKHLAPRGAIFVLRRIHVRMNWQSHLMTMPDDSIGPGKPLNAKGAEEEDAKNAKRKFLCALCV